MTDTLLYQENNLDDLISGIASLENEMQQIRADLARVDTSQQAGGDCRIECMLSLSDLRSIRVQGHVVRDAVSSYARAVNSYVSYLDSLSRELRTISGIFQEQESALRTDVSVDDSAGSVSGDAHGAGSSDQQDVDQGDWFSEIWSWIMKQISTATHANDTWYILKQLGLMSLAGLWGKEFSSGEINEWKARESADGTISINGYELVGADLTGLDIGVWNNDLFSMTWQEGDVGGHKKKMLLPYINIGVGGSVEAVKGTVDVLDEGLSASSTVGDAYAGYKLECGFKDGKFVLNIEGGAEANAISVEGGVKDKYTSASVGAEAYSAGAKFKISYEDGVLSAEGALGLLVGADVDVSVDVGKKIEDISRSVSQIESGDYISGITNLIGVLYG